MRTTALRRLVTAGTAIAAGGCALAVANRLGVRRLGVVGPPVIEPVTVCIPARETRRGHFRG